MNDSNTDAAESAWRPLYRVGSAAAWSTLALIPLAVLGFVVAPPPATALEAMRLFQQGKLLGLVSFDLVYMLTIVLTGIILGVLCVALRRVGPSFVALAAFLNVTATAVYFASNPAFEMLTLSTKYAAATTDAERGTFLAAGEAMLATHTGTAYDASYVLAGVAGLLVASVMLRSVEFSRTTAYLGLGMNVLALVPPTVGTPGMVAAFAFLLPFLVWLVLVARTLGRLGAGSAMTAPETA